MWDAVIEKVKKIIFEHDEKDLITDQRIIFVTIEEILCGKVEQK